MNTDNKKNTLFVKALSNPEEAKKYLNEMLQHDDEADFLFALYNVALAQGGFAQLAEKTGLGRESLYKVLTPHCNPRFESIISIVKALGFDIHLTSSQKKPELKTQFNYVSAIVRQNSLAHAYPELAKQWHPIKNDTLTPNDITPNSRKKIWWKCPENENHEWEATLYSRSCRNVRGCPFCSNKEGTSSKMIYANISNEITTTNKGKKIWWKCSKDASHEWQAICSNQTEKNPTECPLCANQPDQQKSIKAL